MKRIFGALQWFTVIVLVLFAVTPVSALGVNSTAGKEKSTGYETGFYLWQGASNGFASWDLNGVALASDGLSGSTLILSTDGLASGSDTAGAYYGGNFYNGGNYLVGEATSPILETEFAFKEAIASWNANTPTGTWIETQARARLGDRWTKWYNLGVWTQQNEDVVKRHSVRLQGDADGYVAVDTLVLGKSKLPANALQVKVRLFRAEGASETPVVRNISLAYSGTAPKKVTPSTGDPALWNTLIDVPTCSQMVYPDGGNVWCSPTSTSMVLGYWTADTGACEPRVRAAVAGTDDWIYDGFGNWPFNTAYASSQGFDAYVARYSSIADLEAWVKSGVPVVMSIAWGKKDLTGAAIPTSDGHLIVLVGFDANGNAIVNDPAAASDGEVRRTYLRGELENVWQVNSGGTVYLIFPAGHPVPEF